MASSATMVPRSAPVGGGGSGVQATPEVPIFLQSELTIVSAVVRWLVVVDIPIIVCSIPPLACRLGMTMQTPAHPSLASHYLSIHRGVGVGGGGLKSMKH